MALETGVVGAGIVAENNHLPAISRNPRTDLAAVCDTDEGRARTAAAEYGARAYTGIGGMLAGEDLDWVHVATPVQTHADLATEAIEAGVPVLLQKPVAVTLEEVEELMATADEAGVPVSVVHNWLYYPIMREVRERIAAGELGGIRAVETTVTGEGRPDETYRGSWVLDLPGGDLEEGLPHPLYLALATGGFPRSEREVNVLARSADEYDGEVAYDGTQIQYVGEGDTLCSITFLSGSARNSSVRIYGERGSLFVDIPSMTVEAHGDEEGPYHFFNERVSRNVIGSKSALVGLARNLAKRGKARIEDELDRHTETSTDGHYYLINEAAKALERGEQPPVAPEHSYWTLALIERVREAAETDRQATKVDQ